MYRLSLRHFKQKAEHEQKIVLFTTDILKVVHPLFLDLKKVLLHDLKVSAFTTCFRAQYILGQ